MNEISEEDMKSLHDDATNLFNLHFKADADHKVSVSPHLVDEIKQSELFRHKNKLKILENGPRYRCKLVHVGGRGCQKSKKKTVHMV